MKRYGLLFTALLMAFSTVFTSCGDDNPDPVVKDPNITFVGGATYTSNDVTLTVNSDFRVGINATSNATSNAKLTKFTIVRTFNNVPTTVLNRTMSVATFSFDSVFTAKDVAGVERWVFEISDKDGLTKSVTFNVTTTGSAGDIYTYTAILMGGQGNANIGSFWSSATNTVMKQDVATTNQAKVDFLYFYGTTNLATIASPVDEQAKIAWNNIFNAWTVKNDTRFKLITLDWATVTDDSHIVANATALTLTRANSLQVGNIVAFETASTSTNPGKKGLFRVLEITGTSGADRVIKIEVKIQK
ncbi:MAG: hypothetical protein Q7J34_02810 [Bacteroidales bacterium]|jgi:hypothetical protein|nr:hypothetical protein [Bacteroidales bacterium]